LSSSAQETMTSTGGSWRTLMRRGSSSGRRTSRTGRVLKLLNLARRFLFSRTMPSAPAEARVLPSGAKPPRRPSFGHPDQVVHGDQVGPPGARAVAGQVGVGEVQDRGYRGQAAHQAGVVQP
jgi:hypothetical protein